jgi:hypothetical protein
MKIQMACICAFVMANAGGLAQAQNVAGPPELQPIADQFFQQLKKGDFPGAFRSAMKDTAQRLGTGPVDTMSGQTAAMISSFGGVVDWRPLATDNMTPTFVRETYYVRTKAAPLFVTFLFYKADKNWEAVDIQLGTYYREKSEGHLVEPNR